MEDYIANYPATFYIVIANVIVSLGALYLYPKLIEAGYLKPYRTVRENTWYELITSGFLHANLGHLFVNMFTLYFFGPVMERVLGSGYFSGLYLTGLIVAGIPSVIKFKDDPNYATLGASGAVGSVLFAFIFLFPMEKIYLMLIPIPIPAFVFAIFYLIYSMYASKQERGKINHEAHIAGALWGIVYLVIFVPNTIDHFLTVFGLV
ncbi:rhomboid family intramembrane serine protease [Aliifodinibius salipaludis]|uniref:Rhomboid family intramembrane serine protease n=1 Tax=Fodinibius salipaludis TaxID=2032627 RepID=A0A2A2GAL7_9BACT|nr:rhomboid family intramembrane serine protease [Aliifodinibius salipaludis]PAU94378.1 rhomboid family intramembrane serine protease [Aliifodinibius salipaludis]